MAQELRKPLVLHLCTSKGHPMSAVMWEALTMLEQNTHLQQNLEAQVIKPSTSDWASAPVLVRKKDGEVRYTVD